MWTSGHRLFGQPRKAKKGNVNLFTDIPRSTEQVLHANTAFLGTPDEPTTVTLPAPRGATKVYDNDMGEFGTRLFLYRFLHDPTTAARAAAGSTAGPATPRGTRWRSRWRRSSRAAAGSRSRAGWPPRTPCCARCAVPAIT